MSEAPKLTSGSSRLSTVELAPLTVDEDTFCLGVIEYGGNLGAAFAEAFPGVSQPVARARQLMLRPEIALRIKGLAEATEEHALISLGSHLDQLSRIRDLAIDQSDVGVALKAEVKRGEVAGFYIGKRSANAPGPANPADAVPHVTINIGATQATPTEWAKQHGKPPVIIDV